MSFVEPSAADGWPPSRGSVPDYYPIEQAQMMRFDGQRWVVFGEVVSGH